MAIGHASIPLSTYVYGHLPAVHCMSHKHARECMHEDQCTVSILPTVNYYKQLQVFL